MRAMRCSQGQDERQETLENSDAQEEIQTEQELQQEDLQHIAEGFGVGGEYERVRDMRGGGEDRRQQGSTGAGEEHDNDGRADVKEVMRGESSPWRELLQPGATRHAERLRAVHWQGGTNSKVDSREGRKRATMRVGCNWQ